MHLAGITEPDYTLETSFLLTPINQFDQAGLVIHYSADCWVKTGLEYVDGKCRLSCVVTNGGYSDWSTQPWPSFELRIRIHKIGSRYVTTYTLCTHINNTVSFLHNVPNKLVLAKD